MEYAFNYNKKGKRPGVVTQGLSDLQNLYETQQNKN